LGWWRTTRRSVHDGHVVDGLTLATRAGYQIDTARRDRGREKLSAMVTAGKRDDGNPIDDETRAYMIYAFTESGDSDGHYLEELYAGATNSEPYGRALLALALHERKDGRAKEVANTIAGAARPMNSKRTGKPHALMIMAATSIWILKRQPCH